MPSLQNAAPGANSSKFTALNPFTPFFAQPGDLDGSNENGDWMEQQVLSENMDRRLRLEERNGHAETTALYENNYSQSQSGPTTTAVSERQQSQQQKITASSRDNNSNSMTETKNDKDADDSDLEDDDDDDDLLEDDPALEAFRQRRLAEWKRAHEKAIENKAKGHGELRTITQDEFLPECCTGTSEYVAVHFFHNDFERCTIMDHHLKRIAPRHLTCKFVRINAEKAPFFVAKLNIKTLPTLIVFQNGKAIDRLIGFEGLFESSDSNSSSKNPDEFPTSSLGRWLERTGAMEYEGPDSDEEEDGEKDKKRSATKKGIRQGLYHAYNEDL